MLCQKDVIGEYLLVYLKEGGVGIVIGEEKWVWGIFWLEIFDILILWYQILKMDKFVVVNLKLVLMVMEDFCCFGFVIYYCWFCLVKWFEGLVIMSEMIGFLYFVWEFWWIWWMLVWVEGVLDDVCNMYSCYGVIMEVFDVGVLFDFICVVVMYSEFVIM